MDHEGAVRQRYSGGAKDCDDGLCCPVQYNPALLEAIPAEVIERDYGCGDPSRHLRSGETVLDLGSGGGKACFIASQIVGPEGRVMGVDMNQDMLELARRNAPEVARRIGHANVEFLRGHIQDLSPMLADASVDVVISNCVLNLVRPQDRAQLFAEVHRVLRPGGRAVIADIVSDRAVPAAMQQDPELWSGCIAGAFQEADFKRAFSRAGFTPVHTTERLAEPWRVIQGIEFRSMTLTAYRPDPCRPQACGDGQDVNSDGCC